MQLTRKQSNLPAVQTVRAVAIPNNSGAELVTIDQPAKSVRQAIADITIAYRTPGMKDEDRIRLCEIFLKMVAGYPRAVVERTLEYLLEHNPRNTPAFTQPPTPADVKAACEKTLSDWRRWVCDPYFDPPYGKRFGLPTNNEFLTNPKCTSVVSAMAGPKPGEPGCVVPKDLQIAFLRHEIERQIDRIAEKETLEARGEIPRYYNSSVEILVMPDEAFDRIPDEAFPADARERIKTKRAERAEAKRLAEERARAAEEERRHKIERERDEIDREITAIEADNVQAQEAARQELSARWDSVFFVRPNSDTAWHFREWVRHLNDIGRTDVIDQLLNQNSQLAVPSKYPAKDETELPVILPIRDTHELRKRRQWL